jgi:hypothetical protein
MAAPRLPAWHARSVLGIRRGERLLTRPPGYLLEVGPGELDLDRFEELAEAAEHAEAARAIHAETGAHAVHHDWAPPVVAARPAP